MKLKFIIIKYVEYNGWENETWTRYKCIPYNGHNLERVINYVKALNKHCYEDDDTSYRVRYFPLKGTKVFIKLYFTALITQFSRNTYKQDVTIKIYNNDEPLPHETDLQTGCKMQLYKRFGEHERDEKNIGSNVF